MIKIDRFDSQGNLIESIDTRTLEYTKEERKGHVKQECRRHILSLYPEFKQRNAGMGIYSEEENQRIINGIKDCISKCDRLEALIEAQTTKDDIDVIHWGTEI